MLRPPPPVNQANAGSDLTLSLPVNLEPRSGHLAAVTCHFNPCGYRRQRENYFRFRQALRGCPLFTMEVSFDGQFYLSADWQIRATEKNLMWQKEAMINEMVKRLPDRFDQVAWIDADLLFLNDDWAAITSDLLQEATVVQLFENCHFTSETGEIDSCNPSLVRKRRDSLKPYGSPGGAWAAQREFLMTHGLYSTHIVGGGDSCFADAVFGIFNGYSTTVSPPKVNASFRAWAERLYTDVQRHVDCPPGDVVHLYHGTRANRRYVERSSILRDADFDPADDVRIGANGLLEWTSSKPALQHAVREYFLGRREDD